MTVFKIFLFIFLNFLVVFAKISDQRLCYNQDCSEPVSIAKTLLRYSSDDSRILSFPPNQQVKIFSKSAGSRADLWGAEINGKRGYIPMSYVRESRIFHSNLKFLVPTEGVDPATISLPPKTVTETIPADTDKKLDDSQSAKNEIFPNTVTSTYEVIDGTTIFSSDPIDFPSPSTQNIVDNVIEHSEEQINEYATEPTIPVKINTEKVIENLNSDINSNNVKTHRNESEEKIYDLSEEQTKITTKHESESNSAENTIEKTEQTAENANVEYENKSAEITNEQQIKENVASAEITKVENVNKGSGEEMGTTNVESENKRVETANVESKRNAAGADIKDENINKDSDEEIRTPNVESENKSPEIANEQIKENIASAEVRNDENMSKDSNEEIRTTNVDSEYKSAEIANEQIKENAASTEITKDENMNKISDEEIKRKVELENKGAENGEDEEDDTENGDDEADDNGEGDEEEDEENEEKPVHAQDQNTKNTEATTLNKNFENKSEEIVEDTSKEQEVSNNNLGVNLTDEAPSSIEPLNENLKKSDSAVDMNIFDKIDNVTNTFENSSATDTNVEDSVENTEQKTEPGVPSPLSFFFSSQKVKDDDENKVETNTQVPEFSTSDTAAALPEYDVKSSVTTETPSDQGDASHFEAVPPESFTENPNILSNDKTPEFIEIQHDSTVKQSEILKDINGDFSFENQDSLDYQQNNIGVGSVEEMSPKTNTVIDQTSDSNQNIENIQNSSEDTSDEPGFFSNIFSNIFGSKQEESANVNTNENENAIYSEKVDDTWNSQVHENPAEKYLLAEQSDMHSCKAGPDSSCPLSLNQNYIRSENGDINWSYEIPENAYTILLYLTLTAITVLLFSLGYYYIEKRRKDGKLIASINELEQKLLVATKECHLAQNELKITKERLDSVEDTSCGSNVALETLRDELESAKMTKLELEEQIANLEIELEKATETGMEMSQMLNELLTSQSGNEHLMKTINGLQKQLNDQKVTLNHTQVKLGEKNTENELLQTELQVTKEKVAHLQGELDKMVVNILSVQEEKSKIETDYEAQIEKLTTDHNSLSTQLNKELASLKEQITKYNGLVDETKRELDLKSNEYDLLKQSMKDMEGVQANKESLKALLDVSHVKAEVLQLREEKHKLNEKLQKEVDAKLFNEKEAQLMLQEVKILKDKFDEAEKEKVEAETRLEVLSAYFKEREAQYQKEINENESKWMQKEGEATSTIERIKWIQEELQNYKSQNELLKKEILDQEVSLKSQISMLEKKNHENWLLTRQAERKLEESKQEASQLRNRLTIVEKNLNNTSQMNDDSMIQNHSNGDVAVSPLHMTNPENPGSPPLLFPHRDHMTTSPPLQVLPPFMPPPHGVHFMPPPPGVPPFMPPPPPLFPGDHRPPPLGRMSSPPLHGRYSPDSRAYSPYDRDDSPPLSPTYTDDYRRRTPPSSVNHLPPRNYSPYSGKQRYWDDKLEYRGQHHRNKPRPHKGMSSAGSGNSDESLENSGRHSGRV